MKVSCDGTASPAASTGKKMVRFPFSWQHTHVNLLNLLRSCIGGKISVCVFILIPLNIKIKLPLYKTNSKAGRKAMVSGKCDHIESYPTFGKQL